MASFNVKKKAGVASKSVTASKTPLAKFWSEDEIDEKLKGYVEVPEESWEYIKHGYHIRYYVKSFNGNAGGYRPGGFIVRNPMMMTVKDKNIKAIKLQNGFDSNAKGYSQWTTSYESLEKIYMKMDATISIIRRDENLIIRALNDHMEDSKKINQKLYSKIKKLEEEIKMLSKNR